MSRRGSEPSIPSPVWETAPAPRAGAGSRLRLVIIQVLLYSAVAIMPASIPRGDPFARDEYPLVQTVGPMPDLGDLVARLRTGV